MIGDAQVYMQGSRIVNTKNHKEEFLIVITYDDPGGSIERYSERWYIENMFKDLKSNGFNLESTHITISNRLETLMFVLAIAYAWMIKIGRIVVKNNPKRIIVKKHGSLQDRFIQMRSSLLKSKKALSYLSGRDLFKDLEIGFNSYQSGYKQQQNCIVFPLKDKSGNITSLYGRSISDLKGSNHYYLKNRTGLYPGYPPAETKTIIITEAIIDAATLLTHTDFTVLSLFGTNGWNEEHTEAIRSLQDLQEVILFFDGDEPGSKAIETYHHY